MNINQNYIWQFRYQNPEELDTAYQKHKQFNSSECAGVWLYRIQGVQEIIVLRWRFALWYFPFNCLYAGNGFGNLLQTDFGRYEDRDRL